MKLTNLPQIKKIIGSVVLTTPLVLIGNAVAPEVATAGVKEGDWSFNEDCQSVQGGKICINGGLQPSYKNNWLDNPKALGKATTSAEWEGPSSKAPESIDIEHTIELKKVGIMSVSLGGFSIGPSSDTVTDNASYKNPNGLVGLETKDPVHWNVYRGTGIFRMDSTHKATIQWEDYSTTIRTTNSSSLRI